MNKSNKKTYFGMFIFISILFSYIFLEDTLGGARHDYHFHEKFIILFAEDFKNTFNNYGQNELFARNSPTFYIILSLIYRFGLELDSIRYLNFISFPLLTYVFYNCLKLKFKNYDTETLIFLSLIVGLSPTVRSLIVWPYPILYGFILFLFSIKYYLKFKTEKKNKLSNALKNTIYLALASYITPNFCVFVIFFLYKFFIELKKKKFFFYIILLNILLATPAFLYYLNFDFYLIKHTVNQVDLSIRFNFFNKIVIISSLIFFYFLPFISKKMIMDTIELFKNFYKEHFLVFFIFVCIYFFNFPVENFGGGIFFHLSQTIFGNNIILFIVFGISIILFKVTRLINYNNILLFTSLILYNLQVSIYHKYFDPLLLFIFLFLLSSYKINLDNSIFQITKKYYAFYLIFLGISFYKVYFFYR